jgi:hypothetical protein
MAYVELQSLFDAARPAGRWCAMRSNFMAALPEDAIGILVERFMVTPSKLSAVIVEHCQARSRGWPPTRPRLPRVATRITSRS